MFLIKIAIVYSIGFTFTYGFFSQHDKVNDLKTDKAVFALLCAVWFIVLPFILMIKIGKLFYNLLYRYL